MTRIETDKFDQLSVKTAKPSSRIRAIVAIPLSFARADLPTSIARPGERDMFKERNVIRVRSRRHKKPEDQDEARDAPAKEATTEPGERLHARVNEKPAEIEKTTTEDSDE